MVSAVHAGGAQGGSVRTAARADDNQTARYRCAHCRKIVKRKSLAGWIKSWCTQTDRWVHLVRMP